MTVFEYAIGAGHNLPLGSLTYVHAIRATGELEYCRPPASYGTYSPGVLRVRGNRLATFAGDEVVKWRESFTKLQFKHWQDTYCGGGYSGFVTVNTKTDVPTTYERYNATLIMPTLKDSSWDFVRFVDVELTLILEAAL